MQNHIISIGISKHKNPLFNLSLSEKDATDFFELFINNISDIGYQKLLLNDVAELGQIQDALNKYLPNAIHSGDSFFFFFSGHGVIAESEDGISAEHYLVPHDATQDFAKSCLSVSYLKNCFSKYQSNVNIIFVDSCFSGAAAKNSKGLLSPKKKNFRMIKTLSNTISGKGNLTFTACKDNEEALEDSELNNSIFTYFLLTELKKKRDKKYFPLIDAFSPICDNVKSRAKTRYNHNQTPSFQGTLEGNLFLPTFTREIEFDPENSELREHPDYIKLLQEYKNLMRERDMMSTAIKQYTSEIDVKNKVIKKNMAWSGFGGDLIIGLIRVDMSGYAELNCNVFEDKPKKVFVGEQILFNLGINVLIINIEEISYSNDTVKFSIYKKK
jgi:hypothetical protein